MSAAVILADAGNIGLLASAVLTTAAAVAYQLRAHDDEHGRWWRSPFGLHLMCFMIAFAIVLDQSVIYLLTGPGLLVAHPPPGRPDWFAWERTISFAALIPGVLAWRLYLILRPPGRLQGDPRETRASPAAQPAHQRERLHRRRRYRARRRRHDRQRSPSSRGDRRHGHRLSGRCRRGAVRPAGRDAREGPQGRQRDPAGARAAGGQAVNASIGTLQSVVLVLAVVAIAVVTVLAYVGG